MIVCLNNLVPTVSGKRWNINDHFLIMIWYDDWSRMSITMPEWLVMELYRLMLRHSKVRPRVHRTYTVFGVNGCALLSVERAGLLNRSQPHRKILRTCVKTDFVCEASGCRNLGHHKSPKSLGASHLRWYFLCKLNLSHWAAGVSITFKNQVFCKAWFRGVSFHSVAWWGFT